MVPLGTLRKIQSGEIIRNREVKNMEFRTKNVGDKVYVKRANDSWPRYQILRIEDTNDGRLFHLLGDVYRNERFTVAESDVHEHDNEAIRAEIATILNYSADFNFGDTVYINTYDGVEAWTLLRLDGRKNYSAILKNPDTNEHIRVRGKAVCANEDEASTRARTRYEECCTFPSNTPADVLKLVHRDGVEYDSFEHDVIQILLEQYFDLEKTIWVPEGHYNDCWND